MRRGVGYCENTECGDFSKGVFLINHSAGFTCPLCRQPGHVEPERGFYTGHAEAFREVRVEYNFDLLAKRFRTLAVVRDDSQPLNHNSYTLQSPLIRTEQRALKVAEAVLANLNRYQGLLNADGVPQTTERLLSFDDSLEDFRRACQRLAKEFEDSPLAKQWQEEQKKLEVAQ